MSQFLSNPKFRITDSSGNPLNGGLVYTYSPGTTTNKATYPTIADAKAATNANANPVVLDSRGEAAIVLAGTTKLVITDSAGTAIWTLDNVASDSTVLDTNGNELLEFTTTASAVNNLKLLNAATGNRPTIQTAGEADIGVDLENSESEEIFQFSTTASAVNNLQSNNAATTTNPSLSAVGDDTNVGINFQAKGTGEYRLLGTSTQAARLRMYEDTDNGTNYVEWQTPASLTSNATITLPTRNIDIDDQTIKVWCRFNGTGVVAITDSRNVTSVADNGTGNYTVNFSITLANTNYCVTTNSGLVISSAGQRSAIISSDSASYGTTSLILGVWDIDNDAPSYTAYDSAAVEFTLVGGD